MNRKDFITNTSLAGISALCIPDFMIRNEIVFGHQNKKYRINKRWSQADISRYPVNDCHEMVQDSLGRIILLTNETRNNVLIYDKNG